MNKIFKVKVLAFGLFATLALSSCGNSSKQEKATTDSVATEQVKEEACADSCAGCPNAATEEAKACADSCASETAEKQDACKEECKGACGDCKGQCGDC